jgi:hypothetical protein
MTEGNILRRVEFVREKDLIMQKGHEKVRWLIFSGSSS